MNGKMDEWKGTWSIAGHAPVMGWEWDTKHIIRTEAGYKGQTVAVVLNFRSLRGDHSFKLWTGTQISNRRNSDSDVQQNGLTPSLWLELSECSQVAGAPQEATAMGKRAGSLRLGGPSPGRRGKLLIGAGIYLPMDLPWSSNWRGYSHYGRVWICSRE